MKIIRLIAPLVCLLSLSLQAEPKKKALIFLVDQHNQLPVLRIGNKEILNTINLFDYVRSWYLASFTNKVGLSDSYKVLPVIRKKYDHIFYVVGEQCRNDEYMAIVWQDALTKYDVIDYFALVHHSKDQPWFKDDWNIPKNSNKIRFVYNSGCSSGSGEEQVINAYGALAAIGHNENAQHASASPFVSFRVLAAWLNGKNLQETVDTAWKEGEANLRSWWAWQFLKRFGYQNVDDAVEATQLEFSYRASSAPHAINFDSDMPPHDDNCVSENKGSEANVPTLP